MLNSQADLDTSGSQNLLRNRARLLWLGRKDTNPSLMCSFPLREGSGGQSSNHLRGVAQECREVDPPWPWLWERPQHKRGGSCESPILNVTDDLGGCVHVSQKLWVPG